MYNELMNSGMCLKMSDKEVSQNKAGFKQTFFFFFFYSKRCFTWAGPACSGSYSAAPSPAELPPD